MVEAKHDFFGRLQDPSSIGFGVGQNGVTPAAAESLLHRLRELVGHDHVQTFKPGANEMVIALRLTVEGVLHGLTRPDPDPNEVELSGDVMTEAGRQARLTTGARAKAVDTGDLLRTQEEREAYFDAVSAANSGEFVRSARKLKGLTQAQLSALLGVSQGRVSEIESGSAKQGPTIGLLAKIADACGFKLALTLKP